MDGEMQRPQWRNWHVEQIPSKLECGPSTVMVYAAKIEPKLASSIIRELNVKAPLPSLGHVKRIRRTMMEGALELSVILCCVNELEAGDNALMPTSVSEMVEKHGLQPFIVPVSDKPATTKEEWEAQCQCWPTSFHPNAGRAAEIEKLDQAAVDIMCRFMQMAVQVAQLAHGQGQPRNGAIIVDPGLGAVIAWGYDGTGSRCSSMGFGSHSVPTLSTEGSGIDPVVHQNSSVTASSGTVLPSDFLSEPALQLTARCTSVAGGVTSLKFPRRTDEMATHNKSVEGCAVDQGSGHLELPGTQFVAHGFHPLRHAVMAAIEMAAARDRRLFPSDRKMTDRQDDIGAEDIHVSSKKHRPMEVPLEHGVDSSQLTRDTYNPAKAQAFEISRPYLCTGFDIYVTREPCAMCAMALVHQRFRRVIYGVPNVANGALGSRYRLHGKETLNHHYSVFQVSVSEEDLL